MTIPKISLLSSFYNDKTGMKEMMDSVLSQDYSNMEHIIADAGSNDGSVELINEYEVYYKEKGINLVWQSEHDDGISDGINKAFSLMTGDYLIIATDPYTTNKSISLIMGALIKNNADYAFGGINFIKNDIIVRRWSGKYWNWHFGWLAATPTFCVKRSAIKDDKLFKNKFPVADDYDWQIRILKRSKELKKISIPVPLVDFYAGGVSNTGLKGNTNSIKEAYQVLKDNNVPFAWFTNMCKTFAGGFAYLFASRKPYKRGEL